MLKFMLKVPSAKVINYCYSFACPSLFQKFLYYEKIESIVELQRMLRKENPETRDVFKTLCTWNTLKKDLIPILLTYRAEPKIVFAICM